MTAARRSALQAADGANRPGQPGTVADSPPDWTIPRRDGDYGQFLRRVAAAQLRAWLPTVRSSVLDISHASATVSEQLISAGHQVVSVRKPGPPPPDRSKPDLCKRSPDLLRVQGDARSLDWFRPASFDAIIAEGSALSSCLAAEYTAEQATRLLRPGGRLLVSVDSLLLGLARLAEQHRWSELADATSADVVLVPADDGELRRCFGADELQGLFIDAGLAVEWVRPRTVLPPDAVRHALEQNPSGLNDLVSTELSLAVEREGESLGMYLVASAQRPN